MSADALATARLVVPDHVVHRSFETETVLLNLQTGRYHGLNPTAGHMFQLIADTGSLQQTVDAVVEAYGIPQERAGTDVAGLCADLVGRGLLEVGDPPG